jgi:hypothetical protein
VCDEQVSPMDEMFLIEKERLYKDNKQLIEIIGLCTQTVADSKFLKLYRAATNYFCTNVFQESVRSIMSLARMIKDQATVYHTPWNF